MIRLAKLKCEEVRQLASVAVATLALLAATSGARPRQAVQVRHLQAVTEHVSAWKTLTKKRASWHGAWLPPLKAPDEAFRRKAAILKRIWLKHTRPMTQYAIGERSEPKLNR